MKKLDHPNVLSILGICLESSHESGLPFMIMPFMINGDLKSYLKQKRKKTECVDQLPEVPTLYMHIRIPSPSTSLNSISFDNTNKLSKSPHSLLKVVKLMCV